MKPLIPPMPAVLGEMTLWPAVMVSMLRRWPGCQSAEQSAGSGRRVLTAL